MPLFHRHAGHTTTKFAGSGEPSRRTGVGGGVDPSGDRREKRGDPMHVTNAEYFRRQAATCLRLAQVCRDLEVARGLFGLAHEFKTKAAEMDDGLPSMPLRPVRHSAETARD
jgi:hypothetical protein